MRFEVVTSPEEFRDRTAGLLADEARHNLIRGILSNLIDYPDNYEDFRLFLVTADGEANACALITMPYRVVVADTPDGVALASLVDGIATLDAATPGVIGNRPTVDRFVELWTDRTGTTAALAMAQGVFAVEQIRPARPTDGEARVAVEADLETVFDWFNAFVAEAIPDEPRDDDRLREMLLKRLRGEVPGRVWLWTCDEQPVSMSAHTSPTGSGVRVNAVYTPPEHRGKGYASSLVAEQSQWLLDNGHDFCFLFTDLANPTSNKIYESIGYRQVAEAASYSFLPTSPTT